MRLSLHSCFGRLCHCGVLPVQVLDGLVARTGGLVPRGCQVPWVVQQHRALCMTKPHLPDCQCVESDSAIQSLCIVRKTEVALNGGQALNDKLALCCVSHLVSAWPVILWPRSKFCPQGFADNGSRKQNRAQDIAVLCCRQCHAHATVGAQRIVWLPCSHGLHSYR